MLMVPADKACSIVRHSLLVLLKDLLNVWTTHADSASLIAQLHINAQMDSNSVQVKVIVWKLIWNVEQCQHVHQISHISVKINNV